MLRYLPRVKTQIPNNLIYVVLDIPSVQALVRRRQISFPKKAKNGNHFEGSHLRKIIQMAKDSQSPTLRKYFVILQLNWWLFSTKHCR